MDYVRSRLQTSNNVYQQMYTTMNYRIYAVAMAYVSSGLHSSNNA
jgi:hypothetical protein